MITPISSTFPDQLAINPTPSIATAASPKAPQLPTDTVVLSQGAQVHQLKNQGQSASQIAASLGMTVAAVDSTLGVVVATTATDIVAAAPAAAAAPVAAAASPVK